MKEPTHTPPPRRDPNWIPLGPRVRVSLTGLALLVAGAWWLLRQGVDLATQEVGQFTDSATQSRLLLWRMGHPGLWTWGSLLVVLIVLLALWRKPLARWLKRKGRKSRDG